MSAMIDFLGAGGGIRTHEGPRGSKSKTPSKRKRCALVSLSDETKKKEGIFRAAILRDLLLMWKSQRQYSLTLCR